MVTAARMDSKIFAMSGRSRSRPEPPLQATTRLAGQPRFRSTMSKPASWQTRAASARRIRFRAEELRADGVLVVVVGQVALELGLAHAGQTVGGGELRHDEAAAGVFVRGLGFNGGGERSILRNPHLRVEMWGTRTRICGGGEDRSVLDEAAEDGVGNAGHGGEHRRRRDAHAADGELRRHARVRGHGVLGRIVPMLFHTSLSQGFFMASISS